MDVNLIGQLVVRVELEVMGSVQAVSSMIARILAQFLARVHGWRRIVRQYALLVWIAQVLSLDIDKNLVVTVGNLARWITWITHYFPPSFLWTYSNLMVNVWSRKKGLHWRRRTITWRFKAISEFGGMPKIMWCYATVQCYCMEFQR